MTELRSKTRMRICSAKYRGKEGEEQRDGTLWDHELCCGYAGCAKFEMSATQEAGQVGTWRHGLDMEIDICGSLAHRQ